MQRPLYAYEYASVGFEEAIDLLTTDARALLGGATDAGTAHAAEVVAQLRTSIGDLAVGRDVTVEVGEPQRVEPSRCTVRLRWRARTGALLFPRGDAALELVPLSRRPPRTQVSLIGSYDPPFGPLGVVGDVLVGHRIAESTVELFVEDVARRLERVASARPAGTGTAP